jgi:O-antigen ligase
VATVSDRTSDYDAVRPDLWSHLALGRGFGSYDHNTYRILDSEILGRLVETGVLGLAAFLMIGLSVILVLRKTVSARDPHFAPAALCGVAAAVVLLVLATLYDEMAVPHAPYVFLYLAGLAVAVAGPGSVAAAPRPAVRDHAVRAHRARVQRGSPRRSSALV